MKKYIDVVSGFSIKSYGSFEAATLSAKKGEPQRILDKELVDRNHVESYVFSGDRLVFNLDTGKHLEIFPDGERVGFKVSKIMPNVESITWDPELVFRHADYEETWDWKVHLDALIGKEIILSLSEQYLFLLVRGQKDYYMIDYCKQTNIQRNCYLTIGYA